MKYTILINQQAIVNAGLQELTDLTDWAIMDYISAWQMTDKGSRKGSKVWINYAHIIEQMPLLGIKNKGGISKRISKLRELGLIESEQDEIDQRLYIEVTKKYTELFIFSSNNHNKEKKQQFPNGNPSSQELTPVNESQHSINYQIKPSNNTKYLSLGESILAEFGVTGQVAKDYIKTRKKELTRTAMERNVNQAKIAGLTINEAIAYAASKSWEAFTASYYFNAEKNQTAQPSNKSGFSKQKVHYEYILPEYAFDSMPVIDGQRIT